MRKTRMLLLLPCVLLALGLAAGTATAAPAARSQPVAASTSAGAVKTIAKVSKLAPARPSQVSGVYCANFWDSVPGWAGGFYYKDTLYVGYCWNGSTVWARYGPDCSISIDWQGIGGSPYGNHTDRCFTTGSGTGQLTAGYDWEWYAYLSPWDLHPGNFLRFTVDAATGNVNVWGVAGV